MTEERKEELIKILKENDFKEYLKNNFSLELVADLFELKNMADDIERDKLIIYNRNQKLNDLGI